MSGTTTTPLKKRRLEWAIRGSGLDRRYELKKEVAYAVVFSILLLIVSCKSDAPKRPAGVPAKATPVAIPHSYDWDYCWVDKAMNVNRCQIYNGDGLQLYDGIFVRYEGSGVVQEEFLQISQKGGEQWIELQDGTILIPQSHYDQVKRLIDWLKGRRPNP